MAFVDYTLATAMFDPFNKEEAVTAIMEAVQTAENIYAKAARDYNEDALFEARNHKYAQVYEYADKKYKRQTNRDRYIDKEMKAWEALPMNRKFWAHRETISFVDYQFEPHAIGISSNCVVHTNAERSAYEAMYEEVKNNEYFKQATGLSIVITIDTDEKYINSHFRPHAKLVLPTYLEKEYTEAKHGLADDVARFYDGCTYFGD
jgi:hypothetical protein